MANYLANISVVTRALLVSVFIFTAAVNVQAQGVAADPGVKSAIELASMWLEYQMAHKEIPGIAIGIVNDQEPVWRQGFGYADIKSGHAVTPQTIFSLCSIAKVFTATAIMQLRDQEKLDLDDDIAELLPWFNAKQIYEDSGPVTLRGLLSHSSGLPDDLAGSYWLDQAFPSRQEFVALLDDTETLYPAATYEEYSNVGIELAGYVVEEKSGLSYDEYIHKHLLRPLRMNDTSTDIPVKYAGGRLATGYSGLGRKQTRQVIPPYQLKGLAAAAGLASTVDDMAKFLSWQFRLLGKGGTELLRSSTLKEMHLVHWYNKGTQIHRGLGYSVVDINGRYYVGKDGGCPGYLSLIMLNPESKTGGVMMVNANGVDVWELLRAVMGLVEPAIIRASAAKNTAGAGQPSQPLEKYTGVYSSYPSDMEMGVVIMDGQLAYAALNAESPGESLTRLKHVSGDRFIKLRKDGAFGGYIDFTVDKNGDVIRLMQPGSGWKKTQ